LTESLDKTTDPRHLRPLVQALVRLVPRLDGVAAEQAGLRLSRQLGRSTSPDQVAALGVALAELTRQSGLGKLRGLCPAAALRALAEAERARDPKASAALLATLTVLTSCLGNKDAVGLLKHPLCVGECRQAVLSGLSRRLGRRPGSVWELVDLLRQRAPHLDLEAPFQA